MCVLKLTRFWTCLAEATCCNWPTGPKNPCPGNRSESPAQLVPPEPCGGVHSISGHKIATLSLVLVCYFQYCLILPYIAGSHLLSLVLGILWHWRIIRCSRSSFGYPFRLNYACRDGAEWKAWKKLFKKNIGIEQWLKCQFFNVRLSLVLSILINDE